MRLAGLSHAGALKRKKANVKPNEALAKKKPRAIISTGATGVATHLIDAAIIERFVFEDPLFGSCSIKN